MRGELNRLLKEREEILEKENTLAENLDKVREEIKKLVPFEEQLKEAIKELRDKKARVSKDLAILFRGEAAVGETSEEISEGSTKRDETTALSMDEMHRIATAGARADIVNEYQEQVTKNNPAPTIVLKGEVTEYVKTLGENNWNKVPATNLEVGQLVKITIPNAENNVGVVDGNLLETGEKELTVDTPNGEVIVEITNGVNIYIQGELVGANDE